MKEYQGVPLPVGVSLTHDRGYPVVFAYVGGHGRIKMRAKRFNPKAVGSVEEAIKQAIKWRKKAQREHLAAVAEAAANPLPPKKRGPRKKKVRARLKRKPRVKAAVA